MATKSDWLQVGAAWKKDGAKGLMFSIDPDDLKEFMARAELSEKGKLALFVYKNDNKSKANHPDYRLVGPVPAGASEPEQREQRQAPAPAAEDDDLPF